MEIHDFLQVEVRQQVTADDHEALVQIFLGRLDRPGRSHVLQRGDIGNLDAEICAVTEEVFYEERLMVQQHHQFGDVVLFQQLDDMQHDRTVEKRDHRFGNAAGQRLNTGAEATRHDYGFHRYSLRMELNIRVSGIKAPP